MGADGFIVCDVFEDSSPIDAANSKLICAAPELLEALQRYVADDWRTLETRELAKAAIAKATE